LKERQRLREQMDMLNIKREEKIRAKKEASKKKFLEHIFFLQEETKRKEAEQEEAIAVEREKRYLYQMDVEAEEEAEASKAASLSKSRRTAAENKDQAHEEKEEEDLRQLRLRWKAADAEKKRLIEEARARKDRDDKLQKQASKETVAALKVTQGKRAIAWELREKRVNKKMEAKVARALELIPEIKRMANLVIERNSEYLQDWNDRRWPVFEAQLERMRERDAQRKAEADAVAKYHENRSIPQKEKVKGKHAAKGKKGKKGGKDGEKDGKKGGKDDAEEEGGKGNQKDADRIVDGVEAKMREQMAEAKRRSDLESKRSKKIGDKEAKCKAAELKRIQEYKARMRASEDKKANAQNERRLILSSKQEEAARAGERQNEEDIRLTNVRERHVLDLEQRQLEYLQTH